MSQGKIYQHAVVRGNFSAGYIKSEFAINLQDGVWKCSITSIHCKSKSSGQLESETVHLVTDGFYQKEFSPTEGEKCVSAKLAAFQIPQLQPLQEMEILPNLKRNYHTFQRSERIWNFVLLPCFADEPKPISTNVDFVIGLAFVRIQ